MCLMIFATSGMAAVVKHGQSGLEGASTSACERVGA
jgi:hypothetical protein